MKKRNQVVRVSLRRKMEAANFCIIVESVPFFFAAFVIRQDMKKKASQLMSAAVTTEETSQMTIKFQKFQLVLCTFLTK
jgi:hypothetical protein